MSEKVLLALEVISKEFEKSSPNTEKIGLLARSVRWQQSFDEDDKEALLGIGRWIQENAIADSWIVEQTIFEVFCEQAEPQHVPFLNDAFRTKGKHGDDRRRFSLQALSGVAAKYDDDAALKTLEKGLSHVKKDTRGWSIGFLMDSYLAGDKQIPDRIVEKLSTMMKDDTSPDVRVEAARALVSIGFINALELEQTVQESKALLQEKQ